MGRTHQGHHDVRATHSNDDGTIREIAGALHALTRSLKQSKLHEYLLAKAKVDVDRAGMALLYVLFVEGASLRVTDLAEQLQIEPPAVTRKAQDLERAGLVVRAPDRNDARATRLQLTAAGRRTINRILVVRREWLAALFSDWPVASRTEFARLLGLLSERVNEHVKGLDTHQPSA